MILYRTLAGSRLYGLAEEDSDIDYHNIVFPSDSELLGIKGIERVKFSKIATEESTQTSLHQFLLMISKGNHLYFEVLFSQVAEFVHPFFQPILDNKESFLDNRLFEPMRGYAYSNSRGIFKRPDSSSRMKYFELYGYDTKYTMHFFRVCEIIERFAKTGEFDSWTDNRDELLSIKHGKYSLDVIEKVLADKWKYVDDCISSSKIGYNPDIDIRLNEMCIDISKRVLNEV